MKTISQIYQSARDLNDEYHCYIEWFNPDIAIRVCFPGIKPDYTRNLNYFIETFCKGYDYSITGQVLTIKFSQKLS